MRLGAAIGGFYKADDIDGYVAECRRQGYRAAISPRVSIKEKDRIRAVKKAFAAADIVIAEVGVWVNPLAPEPDKRRRNLRAIAENLALADELEAACCVTVAGSLDPSHMVGPHRDNFSETTFDAVVQWVKEILNEVKPRRTRLALEMSAWTLMDGPEVYRRLIEAVDHPALAAHLDPANAIRDAHTYCSTAKLLNDCFDILGKWIVSCHAKDIIQGPNPMTVSLGEVPPGKGIMDYRTYLTRIERLSPDLPLIIEHLASEEEYRGAADYIRGVAREVGVTN